jgi:predicted esterase YcpF (UPF0227 family)
VIVYLHGFRSSPASRKASLLRQRMQALGLESQYKCPALPASPQRAVAIALDIIGGIDADQLALIGSSLGGYYATCIAERLGCRAALLNPAITPAADLAAHVGRQPVYFSDDAIDFRREHVDELRALDTPSITRPERYLLLAATGDALIDYRTMSAKYRGARQIVIEGSDHELSDFANYMNDVLEFCGVEVEGGKCE